LLKTKKAGSLRAGSSFVIPLCVEKIQVLSALPKTLMPRCSFAGQQQQEKYELKGKFMAKRLSCATD